FMMQRVSAFAPATVANLGVGFDVLGLAVDGLGDYVTVAFSDEPRLNVVDIQGDGGKLSREAHKNTAAIAIQSVLNLVGEQRGINIWLEKRLPLASGMGSSAASAVAGAMAINALLGNP